MFFAASVRAVCVPDQEHARRKRRYIFFWGAASIGRRLASFWPSLLGRNGACPPLPFVAPSCFMLPPCLAAWRAAPSLPVVARPPASCWPPCLAAWRAAPSLWLHAGLPPCQSKRNNYLYRRNQKREKNANSQNFSCLSLV